MRGDIWITVGAVLTMLGTWMPWVRSGQQNRSSYGLLGLIDRLEFASGGVTATAVRWWPIVPMLLTATVISAWWPKRSMAAIGAAVAGVYVLLVALALKNAPLPLLVGRTASIGGAIILLGSAAVVIAERPPHDHLDGRGIEDRSIRRRQQPIDAKNPIDPPAVRR